MKASEIISPHFLEISLEDIPNLAIDLMAEFGINELPVMENDEFIGIINRTSILSKEPIDKNRQLNKFFVMADLHLWDVFKAFGENGLEILPVLTESGAYLGTIIKKDLVKLVTNLSSVKRDGAIIELVMRPRDYSLSQISQIIEGNDVKVLSLIVNEIEGEDLVQVIIKLNAIKISGVLQTFGRYGIVVRQVYNFNDNTEWLSERRDALLRYLNI